MVYPTTKRSGTGAELPGLGSSGTPPEELIREKWWTERGSGLFINDEEGLEAVIHYVLDAQDLPREIRS